LLGSGGREAALAAALARSTVVSDLFCAPGNPGIAKVAELVECDIGSPTDVLELTRKLDADLVVVGPEAPLVAGVGDVLRDDGCRVFGPSAAAARIEGSKKHAKALMDKAGVPTASWRSFEAVDPAAQYMKELGPPYVIKADGLAAGKGVVVTEDWDEAVDALEERLVRRAFGDAGRRVVIEEFLDGPEVSLIAITDGHALLACEPAQDYKRVGDDDAGPNTGGMGSYSPVPVCPPEMTRVILDEVIQPMMTATASAGAPFVGALYAGLALTSRGPRVVEFNARFGDPETQALLPRLRSDLGEVFAACAGGDLSGVRLEWDPRPCVSVVLASGGYPGPYETGFEIGGLDVAESMRDVSIFHAGTAERDGAIVTGGGRVLAVSALGDDFAAARERAYDAASKITFEGMRMRVDIAARAVA
jgi:phosphoribosylamine--glycine ligase